jgi:hypothetical protein
MLLTRQIYRIQYIKVVVLTSTIDPEDLDISMVLDFLSKPITVSMLEYLSAKI